MSLNTKKNNNKTKKHKSVFKYKIEDFVRISHFTILKWDFKKNGLWNTLRKIFKRDNQDIYQQKDSWSKKHFTDMSYMTSDDVVYKVEKVIKRRHLHRKQPEVSVKWTGWPEKKIICKYQRIR